MERTGSLPEGNEANFCVGDKIRNSGKVRKPPLQPRKKRNHFISTSIKGYCVANPILSIETNRPIWTHLRTHEEWQDSSLGKEPPHFPDV
jgi:hypothetical protein